MLAELVRGSEDSQGRKCSACKAFPGSNFCDFGLETNLICLEEPPLALVLVTSLIYVYSFRIRERIQPGFLSYQTENTFKKAGDSVAYLAAKKSWPWRTGSGVPSPQRNEILCCPVTETCRSTMSGEGVGERWFR